MINVAYHRVYKLCGIVFGLCLFIQSQVHAQPSSGDACRAELEKAERVDKTGPLSIYQLADKKILIEITKSDLDKDFIYASYIDRGVAPYVGQYGQPKLITFRINGKKIDVIQKDNVGFFEEGNAFSRIRELTTSDAVIGSLKIHKCQPTDTYFTYIDKSVLTRLSADFLRQFARSFSQTSVEVIDWRAFSDNINFISEHRINGSAGEFSGSPGPNFLIRVRHILLQRPKEGFTPRREDQRVGYFFSRRKNLGDIDQSTFDTYIHKWRLDKKDPEAALSEPVKPIVFWIENTTPEKFRPYIKQGVLAWNEAFRAAGFINAIEVYEQPADADWEAGDISRNVIRWQSAYHSRGLFAFAPAIHDPLTGEILGSDILLNFAGIGDYVDDWSRLSSGDQLVNPDTINLNAVRREVQTSEPAIRKITNTISLNIDAPSTTNSRIEGPYLLAHLVENNQIKTEKGFPAAAIEKIQSSLADPDVSLKPIKTAATETPANENLGFAERMLKEVITQLTMHEVGHALGLAHNFRGSRWRSMDEIFDPEKTNGVITASVMDYMPINFSPIGIEQGDFANTRLGPYDIWAIEFGYRPDLNEALRSDFLDQATKPEYAFGNNIYGDDQYTVQNDLTNTPTQYAKARIDFALEAARLAENNGDFGGQAQYFSLFQELATQVQFAVYAITSQAAPSTLVVTQAGDNSNDLFFTAKVHSKAEQKAAIEALKELVFAADALPLSEKFVSRLSPTPYAAEAFRAQVKRLVFSRLINERALLIRHRFNEYGGDYSPTELLFDLKAAVFGSDLAPFAHQQDRRAQQIMFAYYLADLVNDQSDSTGRRHRSSDVEGSIISTTARPVRDALLRELSIPTPWAPRKVRAHRQELRAILQ